MALARYQMIRGKRPPGNPLPEGIRVDVRKHTRHFLRPPEGSVEALFANPSPKAFAKFTSSYEAELQRRFAQDRAPFDALADAASRDDVYIGCSCPSSVNPDVKRCHTVLALRFMHAKYPKLRVVIPK
jgi:hypothetical protein